MKASRENPIYTAYIVSGSQKYNVTPAIAKIDISDQEKQIAKCVTLGFANIKTKNGLLSNIFKARDRVYLYANDGEKSEEVFRGFVWKRNGKEAIDEQSLTLKAYDNLIYFQESEVSEYFSSGKSTKSVISSLCENWGVDLKYSYKSITHSKLALRGMLSDVMTADVLDLVKDRTGTKYVILSEKDQMQVKSVGSNSIIYHIKAKKNAVSVSFEETMDGMITKVVILGKADDEDEREPVEATVKGNTDKYGTIQKIENRDENTSLADAKKDAQNIIDEYGKPKTTYELIAPDIPWIRKGDKVRVEAGILKGYYIVLSIERDITNKKKTMTLTMEDV